MGGCQHLLGVVVLLVLLTVRGIVITVAGNSGPGPSIQVKHGKSGVFLHCQVGGSNSVWSWSKDGLETGSLNQSRLLVGSATDDPRGLFQCHSTAGSASLQLHFRTCHNCIQLDWASVLGIVVANIIATAFLMGAVWCLGAAQDPGRKSRGSDKQALLAHDQLYQPLGERNNGQYSHIGVAKARRR